MIMHSVYPRFLVHYCSTTWIVMQGTTVLMNEVTHLLAIVNKTSPSCIDLLYSIFVVSSIKHVYGSRQRCYSGFVPHKVNAYGV